MSFERARVVMLSTNEKAIPSLVFNPSTNKIEINSKKLFKAEDFKDCGYKCFELYIVSDDEIKEGDWVYCDNGNVTNVTPAFWLFKGKSTYKKIIATTDSSLVNLEKQYFDKNKERRSALLKQIKLPQPPQAFIEVFVRDYNKGNINTDVMVEYELYNTKPKSNPIYSKFDNRIKISKDNTITIKKVKNSWSREEHINNLLKYKSDLLVELMKCKEQNKSLQKEFTDRWIEENL